MSAHLGVPGTEPDPQLPKWPEKEAIELHLKHDAILAAKRVSKRRTGQAVFVVDLGQIRSELELQIPGGAWGFLSMRCEFVVWVLFDHHLCSRSRGGENQQQSNL